MASLRNTFDLAEVVWKFGKQLIEQENLAPEQTKALFNILQCRTASLGGHEDVCDHCGVIVSIQYVVPRMLTTMLLAQVQ